MLPFFYSQNKIGGKTTLLSLITLNVILWKHLTTGTRWILLYFTSFVYLITLIAKHQGG